MAVEKRKFGDERITLLDKIEDLEKKKVDGIKVKQDREAKIQDLLSQIQDLVSENQELKKKKDDDEAVKQILSKHVDELKATSKEKDSLINDREEKLQKAGIDMKNLEKAKENLSQENQKCKNDYEELSKEKKNLEVDLTEKLKEKTNLEADLTEKLNGWKKKCKNLEADLKELKGIYDALCCHIPKPSCLPKFC